MWYLQVRHWNWGFLNGFDWDDLAMALVGNSNQARDVTLWLCQNSYGKWPFVVDFPIAHGDFL